MKMKLNRAKQVLLCSFCLITLLGGCGNNLSEQNNTSAASPEENVEVTEIPGNPESESLEPVQTDNTEKVEIKNDGSKEILNTSKPEVEEMSAEQSETKGNAKSTKTIYEGIYFDDSFYQYVAMPAEESPLIYCEITISNVTDSSFDFVIEEKVMATGESSVLIPTTTAVIEEAGSKAVYKGDSLTVTFSFPDDQNTFPQHLEISGLEKLENKVYINNTIPGHESG